VAPREQKVAPPEQKVAPIVRGIGQIVFELDNPINFDNEESLYRYLL
jgi:hypothetical protein